MIGKADNGKNSCLQRKYKGSMDLAGVKGGGGFGVIRRDGREGLWGRLFF